MKNTVKITCCAVVSAVAVTIMLFSYFPFLTYAIPAIAGIVLLIPTLEIGIKYGAVSYLVTAIITFLVAETEAKLLFIGFFGVYPILKFVIEKIEIKFLCRLTKILSFNILILLSYYFIIKFMGIEQVFGSEFSKTPFMIIFYIVANAVFLVYDKGITQLVGKYYHSLHKPIIKILKLGANK